MSLRSGHRGRPKGTHSGTHIVELTDTLHMFPGSELMVGCSPDGYERRLKGIGQCQ